MYWDTIQSGFIESEKKILSKNNFLKNMKGRLGGKWQNIPEYEFGIQ